ncbi:T9SS type A sorting domain-containing protein [Hymenobacter artigasi]|uniref:T9SS type A sorting domain-containing protein n=1 Tax=Hymenobacter artigasi TaxID=2719616 RepID=A0ABX1HLD9_9BACT|nr:T9SS type A sorting domain-containing protein [Hymenobacter artigasi]NKI91074.1 hypothetical protein [Hymenobacter artigasi]
MEKIITYLSLTIMLLLGRAFSSQAQCTFTAVKDGDFYDPATWTVSGSKCTSTAPVSNSDATIVINGFNVVLNGNYAVDKNGSISLLGGGSLIGGANLTLGDGSGGPTDTNLLVGAGSTLRVAQLTVDKAKVMVMAQGTAATPTLLRTDCNLILVNSDIIDNSRVIINGSIDLTRGGADNTLCGTGSLRIGGCVFGNNGAFKKLAANCASSLVTVCALRLTAGCPGPIDATNNSELECQSLAVCSGPLPVELVMFTATVTGRQGVALRWVTASEKNSKEFVVERSADGKTFNALHTMAAAGSTQLRTTYDYTDEQPLFGTSYYRLRQVDFDGTTAYSPVQTVRPGSANAEGLAVYPGSQAHQWVVRTSLPAEVLATGPATVRVFDALGRSQQITCTPETGQTGRWLLDLRALPTGIYIVRLVSAAGSFSQRIAH